MHRAMSEGIILQIMLKLMQEWFCLGRPQAEALNNKFIYGYAKPAARDYMPVFILLQKEQKTAARTMTARPAGFDR